MSNTAPPKKVLRIGLFQNNRIIEERMLRTPESVTVGTSFKRNMFVVPVSDLPEHLTMFEHKDGQYTLHITKEMTGRVRVGGEVMTFQDVVRQGHAKKGTDGYVLPLPLDAQGRVVIGEATFLFQFVTPPPVRPVPVLPASMRGGWIQGIGITLLIALAISATVHIGSVVFLELQEWPEPLESEVRIPDRFVELLSEQKPKEPEPKPKVEEPKDDGKDKGNEQPEPVKQPAKKAAAKPEPKEVPDDKPKGEDKPKKGLSAEEQAARELERQKRLEASVRNKTLLAALGTAGGDGPGVVDDVLKSGAGVESVDKAMSRSGGMTTTASDVERSGLKSGGSADADGAGGTASIGDIGKSRGASRASSAQVTTATKQDTAKRLKINVGMSGEAKTVGGVLDAEGISRKLKVRSSQFQKCFERQLKKDPKAGGKVIVQFVIGTAGRVTSASATVDSVGGGVGTCVAGIIEKVRFDRPQGGAVTVNKTFVFSAAAS